MRWLDVPVAIACLTKDTNNESRDQRCERGGSAARFRRQSRLA